MFFATVLDWVPFRTLLAQVSQFVFVLTQLTDGTWNYVIICVADTFQNCSKWVLGSWNYLLICVVDTCFRIVPSGSSSSCHVFRQHGQLVW